MHAYANVDRTSPLLQIRNGVRWLTDTRYWASLVYMTGQGGCYWCFTDIDSDSGTVNACISRKRQEGMAKLEDILNLRSEQ